MHRRFNKVTFLSNYNKKKRFDMRIYDAITGKLRKVFTELVDNKLSRDLITFTFGGK